MTELRVREMRPRPSRSSIEHGFSGSDSQIETPDSSDENQDIATFFTKTELSILSKYEKKRLRNLQKNYEMLHSLGLLVEKPEFMKSAEDRQKRKKKVPLKHKITETSISDSSDPDWTPSMDWEEVTIRKQTVKRIKTSTNPRRLAHNVKKKKAMRLEEYDPLPDESENIGRETRLSSKLMSFEALNDDSFFYCSECETDYIGDCPEHGSLTVVHNTQIPGDCIQRAWHTLPPCLSVCQSSIPGAGLGVWTNNPILKRTRFGPYEGETITDLETAEASGYCWKIGNSNYMYFVDGKNQSKSNWLRYVNCCRTPAEQNLMAYQYHKQIFYRTIKPIAKGKELLVWYGEDYGLDMGINPDGMNYSGGDERSRNSATMVSRRKHTKKKKTPSDELLDGLSVSSSSEADEQINPLESTIPKFGEEQIPVCSHCEVRRTCELQHNPGKISSESLHFNNRGSLSVPIPPCEPRKEVNVVIAKHDQVQITAHHEMQQTSECRRHSDEISSDTAHVNNRAVSPVHIESHVPRKELNVVRKLDQERITPHCEVSQTSECQHISEEISADTPGYDSRNFSSIPFQLSVPREEPKKCVRIVIPKLDEEQITLHCKARRNAERHNISETISSETCLDKRDIPFIPNEGDVPRKGLKVSIPRLKDKQITETKPASCLPDGENLSSYLVQSCEMRKQMKVVISSLSNEQIAQHCGTRQNSEIQVHSKDYENGLKPLLELCSLDSLKKDSEQPFMGQESPRQHCNPGDSGSGTYNVVNFRTEEDVPDLRVTGNSLKDTNLGMKKNTLTEDLSFPDEVLEQWGVEGVGFPAKKLNARCAHFLPSYPDVECRGDIPDDMSSDSYREQLTSGVEFVRRTKKRPCVVDCKNAIGRLSLIYEDRNDFTFDQCQHTSNTRYSPRSYLYQDDCTKEDSERILSAFECDEKVRGLSRSPSLYSSPRNTRLIHRCPVPAWDFNQTWDLYNSLNRDAKMKLSRLPNEELLRILREIRALNR